MTLSVEQIREIIGEKIPDGLVVPEHTETEHFYRHTGVDEKYASVTTKSGILSSPYLKVWAAKMAVQYIEKHFSEIDIETGADIYKNAVDAHRVVFEEAGDIGTRGHDIVDQYLTNWLGCSLTGMP